jgi:hypothetical protein
MRYTGAAYGDVRGRTEPYFKGALEGEIMIFRLAFWILSNTITRTILLFALGAFALVGGFGMADEAVKYKKGPQNASIETLPAKIKYEYVKLDAESDGNYVYFESTDSKTKAKELTLFYPLYNKKDLESDSQKPHVTALVKHLLPNEQEGCVKAENCLASGALKLQGRLTNEPFDVSSYTDDTSKKDVLDLLREDYTIDNKTLYMDADWTPSTSEGAGGMQIAGVALLLGAGASFGIPMMMRRRNA